MGGYYQPRQSRVYSRFSLLQEALVRAPKARNWLLADKEHPGLGRNREEKCSLVSKEEIIVKEIRSTTESKAIKRHVSEETCKKEIVQVAIKINFNHPAFQSKIKILEQEEPEEPEELEIDFLQQEDVEYHKEEDAIERYELSKVFQKWLHDAEDPDKLPWNETDAPEHFFVWSKSDRVDPFHGFDWTKSQTGRLFTVKGGRDSRGKIHGKAEITFQNGEGVLGSFSHGKRNGYCQIRSLAKGVEKLSGCWVGDKLEGFATCRFTDGSLAQGWVRDGVWHGAFRYDSF